MEITHDTGTLSIKKEVNENIGFLLTNKKGSYCSFFNTPTSRYMGFFYFDEETMNMYKFIENIEIIGHNSVIKLKNGFYFIERQKDKVIETFLVPKAFNSLIYELNSNNEIDLILDCKDSYDNREWGRYYNIFEEEDCMVVKFTKKSDKKEDSSNGVEEFVLYLAIKGENDSYGKNDEWIERHYPYDEERKSPPYTRYVYNALRLKGSKFVFSISRNIDTAIKECKYIFKNLDKLKIQEKQAFLEFLKNKFIKKIITNERISKEIRVAYINAFNSLNNLLFASKDSRNASERVRVNERARGELSHVTELTRSHVTGMFGGIPWFFQFWTRDALISLKAISKINNESAKKIFFDYLNKVNNDGRLPNLILKNFSKNNSADSHGWLFFRCNEIIQKINKNKDVINSIKDSMKLIKQNKYSNSAKIKECIKKCNLLVHERENEYNKIIYEIENALEKSLNGLLRFHTKNNFEINDKLETWMDTAYDNDARDGARIEIQALRAHMYELMFDLTQNQKYKILENVLKNEVRQEFFNGKILADGLNDFTIRPNLFIAAYVYQKLLSNDEWEKCFETALKSIWLSWGGLSTIDKTNPLYTEISTGEDVKSYHRGDSWFWINNLAASTLYGVDKNKFEKQVQKIISASTEEILWKGCIGCHGELSSAKELSSKGCFSQAWSNAMYIDMIDEVYKTL